MLIFHNNCTKLLPTPYRDNHTFPQTISRLSSSVALTCLHEEWYKSSTTKIVRAQLAIDFVKIAEIHSQAQSLQRLRGV